MAWSGSCRVRVRHATSSGSAFTESQRADHGLQPTSLQGRLRHLVDESIVAAGDHRRGHLRLPDGDRPQAPRAAVELGHIADGEDVGVARAHLLVDARHRDRRAGRRRSASSRLACHAGGDQHRVERDRLAGDGARRRSRGLRRRWRPARSRCGRRCRPTRSTSEASSDARRRAARRSRRGRIVRRSSRRRPARGGRDRLPDRAGRRRRRSLGAAGALEVRPQRHGVGGVAQHERSRLPEAVDRRDVARPPIASTNRSYGSSLAGRRTGPAWPRGRSSTTRVFSHAVISWSLYQRSGSRYRPCIAERP